MANKVTKSKHLFSKFFSGEKINQSTYNFKFGRGNKLLFSNSSISYYFINILPFIIDGNLKDNDIIVAISNKNLVGYKLFLNSYMKKYNNALSYFLDIPVGGYTSYYQHYCKKGDRVSFKIITTNKNNDISDNIICNTLNLSPPSYIPNTIFRLDKTLNIISNKKIYKLYN